MSNEDYFRMEFEAHCSIGTRPLLYALKRTAGGEYVSVFTETAWKMFYNGAQEGYAYAFSTY